MNQPPPERVRTADERVYSAIYDAVQAHRLAPGVKLKEVELTQLLGVSRTSVRNALLKLSHKGIVELAPNRGAVVAQPSVEDCRQLFEARRTVESAVVDILARAADPGTAKRLRLHVKAQRKAFESGDVRGGHKLALDFHRLLAQLAGNRILAGFLDDLLARMPLVILTFGSPRPAQDATHADHLELADAIASGHPDEARRILVAHLEHLELELDAQRPAATRSLAEMLAPG